MATLRVAQEEEVKWGWAGELGAWLAPWEGQVPMKGGRVSLGQILLSVKEESMDRKVSVRVGGEL